MWEYLNNIFAAVLPALIVFPKGFLRILHTWQSAFSPPFFPGKVYCLQQSVKQNDVLAEATCLIFSPASAFSYPLISLDFTPTGRRGPPKSWGAQNIIRSQSHKDSKTVSDTLSGGHEFRDRYGCENFEQQKAKAKATTNELNKCRAQ